MTEPSSSPRGRIGRPARTDLDSLQVQLWASEVEEESQLSAAELDLRYAPPSPRTKGKRVCLWHKYRKGVTSPKDGGANDSTSIVAEIDRDFPGTADWYRHPFWDLVKNKVHSMAELGTVYLGLEDATKNLLVIPRQRRDLEHFWRSEFTAEELLSFLHRDPSLDAGAAILGLVKEGYLCQQIEVYEAGCEAFRAWLVRTIEHNDQLYDICLYCYQYLKHNGWLWKP